MLLAAIYTHFPSASDISITTSPCLLVCTCLEFSILDLLSDGRINPQFWWTYHLMPQIQLYQNLVLWILLPQAKKFALSRYQIVRETVKRRLKIRSIHSQ